MDVLRAFAGRTAVFEIFRNPGDHRLVGLERQGGSAVEKDVPSDAVARSIDRVVFYEQPETIATNGATPNEPVLELPFIPGSIRLAIKGTHLVDRRVDLQDSLVRCFLKNNTPGAGLDAEVAHLRLTLAPRQPTSASYSPVVLGKQKAVWLRAASCTNATEITITRAALEAQFTFSLEAKGWEIELAKKLGPSVKGDGRWVATTRAIEADQPLQIEFWLVLNPGTSYQYRLQDGGLTAVTSTVSELRWRQQPVLSAGGWATHETGRLIPRWRLELALSDLSESLLAFYNGNVASPVHKSLRIAREGQPLSLLPDLVPVKDGSTLAHPMMPPEWLAELQIEGEWPIVQTSGGGVIKSLRFPSDFTGAGNFQIHYGRVRPARLPHAPQSGKPAPDLDVPTAIDGLLVQATFRGFATTAAAAQGGPQPLALKLLAHGFSGRSFDFGDSFAITLALSSVVGTREADPFGQRVRLGALELAFGSNTVNPKALELLEPKEDGSEPPILTFSMRTDRIAGPAPVVSDLQLRLGVLRVGAAGQDALPNEEFAELFEGAARDRDERAYEQAFQREAALVLELPGPVTSKPPAGVPYRVHVVENVLSGQSQTVDLRLTLANVDQATATAGTDQKLLIVDRDPLLIAEVRFVDLLADLVAATTTEVANYSTRSGSAWEMTAGATGFDLVLPPQGVGEAMEKNRGTDGGRPADVTERETLAYRFTPPTVMRVQPAYYRQRFAEPPWNLRRLLGFPGQRDPGMTVDRIDFELFYSLAGRVERTDLRLAEISGRLGALPGRQPREPLWSPSRAQHEVYTHHRSSWAGWYELLLGRLAVLEPWRDGQHEQDLALTDGVSYAIRESARLAFPVPLPDAAKGRLDIPFRTYASTAQLRALGEDTEEERAFKKRCLEDAPGDPLPGGVAWPFESLNLYNLLWRTPNSTAGELHRPYFSAFGGWGFQKATFAEGQLRIYADTAMGRTHSVTLEVLGRISIGWHLAKHVIVYERSVLPSRQFVNEATMPEQDELRGRPVLRKVREYVEILEPSRRFPDNAAAVIESGCLLGIDFPDGGRRINVTSRWGEDVGLPNSPDDHAEGWKVPLWVRGALPSDIYPKPQVLALFAQAQGDAPVRVEIDEPEKLYFFTNTKRQRASSPHLWPAVQGIDFGWAPPSAGRPPKPPDAWTQGEVEAPADPLRADPAVKGGLSPFTFALSPASHAVNIVGRRRPETIGASLRNITLMRGQAAAPLDLEAEPIRTLIGLRDHVAAAAAPAVGVVPSTSTVLSGDAAAAAARALLDQFNERLKPLREAIDKANPLSLPSPGQLCPHLTTQVRRVLSPVRSAGQTLGQNFTRITLAAVQAATDLNAAQAIVSQQVAGLESQWLSQIQRLDPLLAAARRAKDELLADADDAAHQAIDAIGDLLIEVDALPNPWLAAAVAWPDTMGLWHLARKNAARTQSAIDAAAVEATRPWTSTLPDKLRTELRTSDPSKLLENALIALNAKALSKIEEAFEEGSQNRYEAARKELRTQLTQAHKDLQDAWTAVYAFFASQLDDVIRHATSIQLQLKTAAQRSLEPVRDLLAQLPTTSLEAFRNGAATALNSIEQGWNQSVQDVEDAAINAIGAQNLCEAFFAATDKYLEYLRDRVFDDARLKRWIDETLAHFPNAGDVREQLLALERELGEAARGLLGRASADAQQILGQLATPVMAAGDTVLRLVRAFGEAPRVPALDFRLPEFNGLPLGDRLPDIGYYFQDLARNIALPQVDITPVLAAANRLASDAINGLEIKLPTTSLFDRLQPASLPNFDLRRIFPNFAGLQLADLFEGVKLPQGADDNVRITHGEDPQSFRGWVQIEVDQSFTRAVTLFTFAGFAMQIEGGRFRGLSRIEGGSGQPPRQSFRGDISGDWTIRVGGSELVLIEQTSLRFDDGGRITFDVRPDKVKLPGPMSFLADLISRFNFSDKGFSFKVTPSGALVTLNLPLPDIQGGAFGLANLSLGFFFELSVVGGFVITGGANVASRKAPFTITVFVLGGAGWFDLKFRYAPSSQELVANVSIGIMAAASLAISLGPISGGIYAYFGIVTEYTARRGAGSQLTVTLVLRFVGNVSLLGIVTAFLEIGLEAQYSQGGGLVGRGYINVEIKICWCFTLRVGCSVRYTFGSGSGGSQKLKPMVLKQMEEAAASAALLLEPPVHETAAAAYVAMFA